MSRFQTAFLALIVLGTSSVMAWMLARPDAVDKQRDKLEYELLTLRKTNEQLKQQLAQSAAASTAKAAVSAGGPGTQTPGPGKASPGEARSSSKQENAMGGLLKMMTTPVMRTMMEQQQAAQIETGYGKLMDILQLSDEEKAHFKKLLLKRGKSETEAGLRMLNGDLTDEEKKKIVKELQVQRKVYDDSIKTFLNDAGDYDTYQRWEDSRPERMLYDLAGHQLFAESDAPLSEVQEQQLIDLMVEARKATPPAGMSNMSAMDPTKMTPEKLDSYMRVLESQHQRVRTEAAKVLTPSQLLTLDAYLQQSRTMSKTGLQMSGYILKGGSGNN